MRKLACIVFAFLATVGASLYAQEEEEGPLTPEQQEQKMQEYIDDLVSRLESTLKLEDWQVYYVDSILNNDYKAMQKELTDMQKAKISNTALYSQASDKWSEQIYNSMHKVLNEDQWKKYLKSGAAREKKARDKRMEKRSNSN